MRIVGYESKLVRQGRRRDDQIQGAWSHSSALLPKSFAQCRAATSNLLGERQGRHDGDKRLELGLRVGPIRATQHALKCLHVGDDGDEETISGKFFEQRGSSGLGGKMVEDNIGVEQKGHMLRGPPVALLPPGVAKLLLERGEVNPQ